MRKKWLQVFRFIKEQEATGLLSTLGIKTDLDKIPIVDPISFWRNEMNEIINRSLLAWDKFLPEMYLRQPGFTYSACILFTKTHKDPMIP